MNDHTITITLTVEEWAKAITAFKVYERVTREATFLLKQTPIDADADLAVALVNKFKEASKQ